MASPVPDAPHDGASATVLTDSLKMILEQVLVELTHLATVVWDLGFQVWVWVFFGILVGQLLFDSRAWLWHRTERTLSTYWKVVLIALACLVVIAVARVFVWRAIRVWWAAHVTAYWTRMQEAASHIFTGATLTPTAPLAASTTPLATAATVPRAQPAPTPLAAT